jgi:hypothetical protein
MRSLIFIQGLLSQGELPYIKGNKVHGILQWSCWDVIDFLMARPCINDVLSLLYEYLFTAVKIGSEITVLVIL